jgi:hypothetical protein
MLREAASPQASITGRGVADGAAARQSGPRRRDVALSECCLNFGLALYRILSGDRYKSPHISALKRHGVIEPPHARLNFATGLRNHLDRDGAAGRGISDCNMVAVQWGISLGAQPMKVRLTRRR